MSCNTQVWYIVEELVLDHINNYTRGSHGWGSVEEARRDCLLRPCLGYLARQLPWAIHQRLQYSKSERTYFLYLNTWI